MAGFHAFRSFQKNRKMWLASLGVLTMISFILLPVLMQLFSGGGDGANSGILVQCRRFGKIDERTIYALAQNREHLGRFYNILYQLLADPNNQERQIALRDLEMVAAQYGQQQESEDIVNNWLLSQYAKEKGITIDRFDIIAHLTQLTGGFLTNSIYKQTLDNVGMSDSRLEYLISEELLNRRIYETFGIGLGTIPPSTRWEWFQRLNRQIMAEIVAVPVDQFVDKVPEPNNAQLQLLFNQHKDKPFDPTSAEYGFTMPTQLAFQYVKATPNQKVLDSISDDEIKKYYEENKESLFRKPAGPLSGLQHLPSLPGQGSGNLFQSGGLGGFAPGGTTGARPFPVPPRPRPTSTIKLTENDAETHVTPTEKDAESGEKPETKPVPAESSQPESAPAEEKPETVEPEKNETSSNSLMRTRFVSYRADEEPAQPEQSKPEEPKPQTQPEQPKPEEPKPQTQPEQPKPEEPKPQTQPEQPKPEEPKVQTQPEQPKPEEPKVQTQPEQPKPEEPIDLSILYKPLDEVKDQIRLTLATEKVLKSVPLIEEKMREYFQTYNIHVDREEDAPPMPDLTGFVGEQSLELKTVPLGTIYEAIKSEFARGAAERDYLIQLFNESPILFEPKIIEGENTLFWVTHIQPESKPEKLDDIKELVLQRWKETEARPLALRRAEELADEAKNADKSLAETFAGRNDIPVVETEPFTYKSYGASMYAAFFAMRGIPPRLGEVCEKGVAAGDSEIDNRLIFAPGVEFMEEASALGVGEIGVVFNQPQTVAYVIRIIGSSPSDEVLWERFQNANIVEYRLAGQHEMILEARTAWLNKIYEEVGFKWIRKPEPIRRR